MDGILLRLKNNDPSVIAPILYLYRIMDKEAIALALALENNTSLRILNLSGCFIGDKGAIALARALEKNASITKLLLNDNRIKDEGAFALARMITNNTTLTHVDLVGMNLIDIRYLRECLQV